MASKFNKEHQLKNGIADPIQYVSANMKICVFLNDTDLSEILKLISELEENFARHVGLITFPIEC